MGYIRPVDGPLLVRGFTQIVNACENAVAVDLRAMVLTVVGVCETLGAIGLLIRQVAVLAALGLCGILIGVFYTLIHVHMYSQLPVPLRLFF